MISAEVFAQIERMGDLPSLPRTLLSIQHVASDDRSSAEDLANCILADQALTMRVLKVVNSAMYQRRRGEQVLTVHRAVVVMGFETVRKLALGLSVFDMMSKLSRSPQLADIARHSLTTAGLAQVLAEATGTVPPEEAFVTALVHDIGKVVLIECSAAAMDAVRRDIAAGAPPLEAERRHYGITHDRAGRRLASRWQLPLELQNIIGDHHDIDPAQPPRRLDSRLGVIVFANALGHCACGDADTGRATLILHRAARALEIPVANIEPLARRLQIEVEDLAERVGAEIDDLSAYADLVNVRGSAAVAPRHLPEAEVARRTARQLELYRQVGQGLASGAPPATLLQAIVDGAVEILGFERAVLLRIDRTARRFAPWAWAGLGADLQAARLDQPFARSTGARALAALDPRTFHVPMARSAVYQGLAGDELLDRARCAGFAAAPVGTPGGVVGVLYGDGGAGGHEVGAEQATELAGLATQAGLVCSVPASVAS
ncbi:MAG: HDOD domain-containing protein [Candidatus Krumholzibacteriia bacterium]